MGAGICGTGPTHYDSTVTLTKLVQKIARFRDKFYQLLLDSLDTDFGRQLKAEAEKLKQPFGGVRQSLNQAIAAERALHLQERRLAVLFAAMGYPAAARARRVAEISPITRSASTSRAT
jgi:23S rRNA C2498 (ribose-2'-O)-methylase RlmM